MTRAQYLKNCKELKKDVNEFIDNRIEKALTCGAIDLKEYENDFFSFADEGIL